MTGALVGRAEAITTRVSLLYSLLDRSAVIEAHHLCAALAVWDYALASARYLWGDSLGDPDLDRLDQVLREAGPVGLDMSQLHDRLGNHWSADKLRQSLTRLAELDRATNAKKPPGPQGGRPQERWFGQVSSLMRFFADREIEIKEEE
jgi:hypothetical protein